MTDPYLVYDVEVLRGPDEAEGGWDNPEAMGFGTAVVYDSMVDRFLFFGQGQKARLKTTLIESLRNRVLGCNVICVGFNHVLFDVGVLYGNDHFARGVEGVNDVDLLIRVIQSKFGVETLKEAQDLYGHKEVHDGSCGLDALCNATIGRGKTGHGAKAPLLIREGRWAEVFAYNLEDVRLTRDLYLFGLKYGYVIDGNGRKILVDFNRR